MKTSNAAIPAKDVALVSIRRLISDGTHNAFTTLLRYGDSYFLSWRTSSGHGRSDGDIRLMRSDDGIDWKECNSPFRHIRDYKEGHMVVFNGRLCIYGGTYDRSTVPKKNKFQQVAFSTDGLEWTEPVSLDAGFGRFWKPLVLGETMYVAAYRFDRTIPERPGAIPGSSHWTVDLLRSKNGVDWEPVSEISTHEGGNETELVAESDGTLRAFIRCETEPFHLIERRSKPPYNEWSERIFIRRIIQGQVIKRINGRLFMSGREHPGDQRYESSFARRDWIRSKIWVEENGFWVDYCTLPSGYDCSYAGMEKHGEDTMLISYYSQHMQAHEDNCRDYNSPSDIFLAEVKTDCPAQTGVMSAKGEERWNNLLKAANVSPNTEAS